MKSEWITKAGTKAQQKNVVKATWELKINSRNMGNMHRMHYISHLTSLHQTNNWNIPLLPKEQWSLYEKTEDGERVTLTMSAKLNLTNKPLHVRLLSWLNYFYAHFSTPNHINLDANPFENLPFQTRDLQWGKTIHLFKQRLQGCVCFVSESWSRPDQ